MRFGRVFIRQRQTLLNLQFYRRATSSRRTYITKTNEAIQYEDTERLHDLINRLSRLHENKQEAPKVQIKMKKERFIHSTRLD
jgi:hypothetical protein